MDPSNLHLEVEYVPGVSVGDWALGTERQSLLDALHREFRDVVVHNRELECTCRIGTCVVAFSFSMDGRLCWIEVFEPVRVVYQSVQLMSLSVSRVCEVFGYPVAIQNMAGVFFPSVRVSLFTEDRPTPSSAVVGIGTWAEGHFGDLPGECMEPFVIPSR